MVNTVYGVYGYQGVFIPPIGWLVRTVASHLKPTPANGERPAKETKKANEDRIPRTDTLIAQLSATTN